MLCYTLFAGGAHFGKHVWKIVELERKRQQISTTLKSNMKYHFRRLQRALNPDDFDPGQTPPEKSTKDCLGILLTCSGLSSLILIGI